MRHGSELTLAAHLVAQVKFFVGWKAIGQFINRHDEFPGALIDFEIAVTFNRHRRFPSSSNFQPPTSNLYSCMIASTIFTPAAFHDGYSAATCETPRAMNAPAMKMLNSNVYFKS